MDLERGERVGKKHGNLVRCPDRPSIGASAVTPTERLVRPASVIPCPASTLTRAIPAQFHLQGWPAVTRRRPSQALGGAGGGGLFRRGTQHWSNKGRRKSLKNKKKIKK